MNKKIVGVVVLFFCAFGVFVWQKQIGNKDHLEVPAPSNVTRYDQELNLLKSNLVSIGKKDTVGFSMKQMLEINELIIAAEDKLFELKKTAGTFRDVVKADLEFLLEDIKDKTEKLKQVKPVVK
jgi:hypothetical protein